MKTKNIMIIIVCIVFTAFVFGATGTIHLVSASENVAENEEASSDRLIGMLITQEYLDLFDIEQFFTDNTDKLVNGGVISESESAKYQGKLYAVLEETEYTDEETGETYGRKEFVFEGINGICYIMPQMEAQFGSYWSVTGDEAITDGGVSFITNDEGESVSIEGTIYVSTSKNVGSFYFNPVYQTQAGEVYAVGGNGMSLDNNGTAGMSMNHERKENQLSTVGDVTTAFGSEIKITICYMDEPAKVSILQFDKENTLLSRIEYEPDNLPYTLQTQPGAQYIIVETTSFSKEGAADITREIYQSENETLSAFYCRDDGICVKQECKVEWSE